MIESQNKVRLGELLVDSDVVSSADLTEAIQVSSRLNIPIGRVLLLSGLVSPVTLEAALEAQPLLNDEKESVDDVIQALKEVESTGKSLNKMLPSSEYKKEFGSLGKDKLAELLLDSEIVSQDQLDQALSTSFEAGVPLGSALVLEGILSPSLFPSILQIQQNVRVGNITKEQAIEQVKSTFVHWLKAEESLSGKEFSSEVFENADNKTNSDEKEVERDAKDFADQMAITFDPVPTPPKRESTQNNRLIDLLIEAGRLKEDEIDTAIQACLQNPHKSAELLELLGLIDNETRKNSVRCTSLLKNGQISKQEALYVLDSNLTQALANEEEAESQPAINKQEKIRRYFDKEQRKSMFSKVVGGMVVGVCVAGYSLFRSRGK